MAAPVYPTILTKADWDENKGTIGEQANELGIAAALDGVWSAWCQIDWNAALDCRPVSLKILDRRLIIHLIARLRGAIPRVAAARISLLELGDLARDVAARHKRAATFPKATIGHVRNLKDAAIAFAAELEQNDLQRELLMALKAKGYARLREHDLDQFLDNAQLARLYLPAAKNSFCEASWRFLMETRCATKGQLPPPERVPRIYSVVKSEDADVSPERRKELLALHEQGLLVRPPAGSEARVLEVWRLAHQDAQSLFPSRYRDWRNMLALDDNESLLLDPLLQA